jgi:DNA-directed RNA polymerase beta' subunit
MTEMNSNALNMIESKIKNAAVHAGEMVGSVAAQSIGEPATQMSIRGTEHVMIRDNYGARSCTIKSVIDPHCDRGYSPQLQVLGVSPSGNVRWANVIGVSRHPANGIMLRVTTSTGKHVVATASHSFLTRDRLGMVVPIRGDSLNIGDVTPILNTYPSNEEEARRIGTSIRREESCVRAEDPIFIEWITGTKERMETFMQGLVENSDGSVRIAKRYVQIVNMVANKIGYKYSTTETSNHMFFSFNKEDVNKWLQQIEWDYITNIENLGSSNETVYDFTVEQELQSFMLTNGLFVHNTLNTFHTAGVGNKNVSLGIPRLKEILDVSKNPKTPSTTIMFKKPFSNNAEFANYFAQTLPLTRLGDIVSKYEILYDSEISDEIKKQDEWFEYTNSLFFDNDTSTSSKCVARLQLNRTVMETRYLTPPIVRRLLQNRLDKRAFVSSSETNSIDWIIRIRFARVTEMMNNINFPSDREAVLCHSVISTLLDTMALSGQPGVKAASVIEVENQYLDENENLVQEKEYAVSTLGECLFDIAASPCVDWYRSTTNDITQLIELLGIEATSAQLFEQLNAVVSFDGTYIDPRHLTMIVNTMCRNGALMALNRHGINRSDTGPLGKCSFEETPDVLCDAAMFGETDNAKGVSTAIMTGQLARIGSGSADVLFHSSCIDPRSIDHDVKTYTKPWRSTCRSYKDQVEMEGIEYTTSIPRVSMIVDTDDGFQKPFTYDTSTNEEGSRCQKRVSFRPRSPETK